MNSSQTVINKLLELFKRDLPTLLTYAELDDFTHYQLGSCKDAENLGIYVARDNSQFSIDRQSMQIIVHLQLPKSEEKDCSKYDDIVKNYLFSIDPDLLGFDKFENMNIDSWSPTNQVAAMTFITVSWSHDNDDCDVKDYATVRE